MKSEQFEQAMNQIKDDYILEAMEKPVRVKEKQEYVFYRIIIASMIVGIFLGTLMAFSSDERQNQIVTQREKLITEEEARERLNSGCFLTDSDLTLPSDYEILDIQLVHLKDSEGKDIPYYCFSIYSKDVLHNTDDNSLPDNWNYVKRGKLFFVPAMKTE